jgi:hypothetical protein
MTKLKSKSRLPGLDYQTQNRIQDIAIANGVVLTYNQMQQFANYRADPVFAKTCDKAILYLVMTPAQRERFDRLREQDLYHTSY